MAGVISQQLANEPSARVEEGRFTRLTRTAMDMFFHFYAPKEGESDDADLRGGRTPAADRP